LLLLNETKDDFNWAVRLPDRESATQIIHDALHTWRRALDEAKKDTPPFLLICLRANSPMPAQDLDDDDKKILLKLAPYSKKYGFDLQYVQVYHEEKGMAYASKWHPWGPPAWGSEDYTLDELKFAEREESGFAEVIGYKLDGTMMDEDSEFYNTFWKEGGDYFVNGKIKDVEPTIDFDPHTVPVSLLFVYLPHANLMWL
jgi:hypothetical protein